MTIPTRRLRHLVTTTLIWPYKYPITSPAELNQGQQHGTAPCLDYCIRVERERETEREREGGREREREISREGENERLTRWFTAHGCKICNRPHTGIHETRLGLFEHCTPHLKAVSQSLHSGQRHKPRAYTAHPYHPERQRPGTHWLQNHIKIFRNVSRPTVSTHAHSRAQRHGYLTFPQNCMPTKILSSALRHYWLALHSSL